MARAYRKNHQKLEKLKVLMLIFSDDIKSIVTEIEINSTTLSKGNKVMELEIPEETLVVMINRDNNYFIPKGNTILMEKDKLLIITVDHNSLRKTLKKSEYT